MNINRDLVIDGLRLVRREKIIQGKIIDAINEKNYTLASYLIAINDRICDETDKIANNIIDSIDEKDMLELNEKIEDLACEKYGGNTSEGLSLSLIISNKILERIANGEIMETNTFSEEIFYIIHSLAVEKYLNAKDGLYKEEILEHINNNISRSDSLRALFRGDREKFDKYNPDLYFDPLECKIYGEDSLQVYVLTTCITLEELNRRGFNEFMQHGFTKTQTSEIVKSQKDMEKIKLASYYIQAKERGYDIKMDYDQFSDVTQADIRNGFELGDSNVKRFIKK